MAIKNLVGQKFGRLTVLSFDSVKNESACWMCKCDCGTVKVIRAHCLKTGNTLSCGCLNSERRASPKKHGKYGTKIYRCWSDMIARCHRPSCRAYPLYGARGIRVHPWWHEFINFYVDMGEPVPGMEIDRIDGRKGYEPGNCRWVTSQQNSMNTGKHKSGLSRFKGVQPVRNRWAAAIKFNRKNIYIGSFATEEEAAIAYDKKAKELFGDFACTNATLYDISSEE